MILNMPKGYDTYIGDNGAVLSGGQRQRIGLARALYGDPKLVVLDEPNASLDEEGERALLQAMAHLKQLGTTVVVITHKVSLLAGVDKLLVMQDGALAVFGPREGVLQHLLQQQQKQQKQQKQLQEQQAAAQQQQQQQQPAPPDQPQETAAEQQAASGEEVPRG